MKGLPEVAGALARSELFACCSPEELSVQLLRFSKNSPIPDCVGDEPAVGMVVQGRVQVYSICMDGTAVNLSTLNPGDSFGISSIFVGEELSTSLACDRRTVIAYISQSCFFELLAKYPQMMHNYAVICNRKIRFLTRKIEFLTIPSCRGRLASYLLHYQKENWVKLEYSKEQLARVLGASRASLYRELRDLCHLGLIRVEGRSIELLDIQALSMIVSTAS